MSLSGVRSAGWSPPPVSISLRAQPFSETTENHDEVSSSDEAMAEGSCFGLNLASQRERDTAKKKESLEEGKRLLGEDKISSPSGSEQGTYWTSLRGRKGISVTSEEL
ncbi:unnamed protein product [Pleuronectes platessa]|uniref:Uncharacterized protein n=1 Tax=Pleuronectes platessa TaxID=8262 RepID=A0A9N7UAL4_PLEPL|nr:unnamed protein product [Pleuronectes platessa]